MEKPCQQISPRIQLYETLANWLFLLSFDVWSCSPLTVETWKDQTKEAFQLASQQSNERKTKNVIRRNTKGPCLTTLEPGDRVLILSLSERDGTDKMRIYLEE